MEDILKRINNIEDLAHEFIGIFKDGILSRAVDGKNKPLTYRISKLEDWVRKDGWFINDINNFVDICNKYIKNDENHYGVVGKLSVKGENILCSHRGE